MISTGAPKSGGAMRVDEDVLGPSSVDYNSKAPDVLQVSHSGVEDG